MFPTSLTLNGCCCNAGGRFPYLEPPFASTTQGNSGVMFIKLFILFDAIAKDPIQRVSITLRCWIALLQSVPPNQIPVQLWPLRCSPNHAHRDDDRERQHPALWPLCTASPPPPADEDPGYNLDTDMLAAFLGT
jgi:hypothetical protein